MIAVTVNGWMVCEFETREFAMTFVNAALDNGASEIRMEVKP